MVALIIETEEELEELRQKVEIDDEDVKLPGLYYEHLGEWYTRYLYDAEFMSQCGYVIAKPVGKYVA